MSGRPDMARGTRNAAIAINSSYDNAITRRQDTPLGERWSVYGVTVTGQTKEVAMLRTQKAAEEVEYELRRAIVSLRFVAAAIARDREGAAA